MNTVTPFLMFNDQLEAAIKFYTATFPNSEVRNVARTGKNDPISSAEFVVGGQAFMGYNGGSYFSFSEGVSLYVDCADQEEVDEYKSIAYLEGRKLSLSCKDCATKQGGEKLI